MQEQFLNGQSQSEEYAASVGILGQPTVDDLSLDLHLYGLAVAFQLRLKH